MEANATAAHHTIAMAQRGDPSAFYSLFGGYARAAYIEARGAGRDHRQAAALALAFMRKTYLAFTDKALREPLDVWFEGRKNRSWRLKETGPASTATEREVEDFDAHLQMALQRAYSGLRHSDAGLEGVLHVRRYMLLHPIMRVPIYGALVAGMVAAGFLYLNLSVSQVSLSLKTPLLQRTLTIASTPGRFFDVRVLSQPTVSAVRIASRRGTEASAPAPALAQPQSSPSRATPPARLPARRQPEPAAVTNTGAPAPVASPQPPPPRPPAAAAPASAPSAWSDSSAGRL